MRKREKKNVKNKKGREKRNKIENDGKRNKMTKNV